MKKHSPKFIEVIRAGGCAGGRRGFSAIEVTAVAAIIFVLALVLIPIVNKRVDESKITACHEDLIAIQKAEEIAYGYTGHYFRLCDLDRPMPDTGDSGVMTPSGFPLDQLKVPPAYWNAPLNVQTETSYLIKNWHGPLLPNFRADRSITLVELAQNRPDLVNVVGTLPVGGGNAQGGPIMLCPADDYDHLHQSNGGALRDRRWPLDPWGNPYLFFGSGFYGSKAGQLALDTQQETFTSAVVYSMGPDGVPGALFTYQQSGQMPTAKDYFREKRILGTGDDLSREF